MALDEALAHALSRDRKPMSSAALADEIGPASRLTACEREVAPLVAEGLSNQQIAHELVLSERTVDVHVSNILRKLGLSSRAQLAAWVVRNSSPPEPTEPDSPPASS